MTAKHLAEIAFRLHEEKHISRGALVDILQNCVNLTALENAAVRRPGDQLRMHRRGRRGR